jgi:hypothetical protein
VEGWVILRDNLRGDSMMGKRLLKPWDNALTDIEVMISTSGNLEKQSIITRMYLPEGKGL